MLILALVLPRATKEGGGGGYPRRFVSGRTNTQKEVTPGI